jgi:hypothetical protein
MNNFDDHLRSQVGGDVMRLSEFPRRVKVADSSNISAVYYSHEKNAMAVKFHSSERCWYYFPNVSPAMFAALISEESVGRAFHRMFRMNNAIVYERVSR